MLRTHFPKIRFNEAAEFLVWAAAVMAVVLLSGCGPKTAQNEMPPPVVTVAPATERDIVEWDEFTGRTEAVASVEVRPRVSGHIQEVRFQSGQLVKKGDVLFIIDPSFYQAEANRREAEVTQAKAHLENAERNANRATRLLVGKAISSEEGDTANANFQEAKAAVQTAQAIAESAQLDLQYTTVRAPIAGRVSRALLTEGNYVSGVAGGASLLTTLVSVDPIYVYADIDENSLLRFQTLAEQHRANAVSKTAPAVPVELELADEDGYPRRGTVESFDNRLDASTGTILLRAVFANPDGRMVPGLYARIRVQSSAQHPAVLVNEEAIGTDQAQKFVLTLDPANKVQYRKVELGPIIDGQRVVRTGLKGGERIVVNGLQRARPGSPVTPQEQVAANPATAPATAKR